MNAGAWRERSFRLLFFGQGISSVGDRIVAVALAFAVLDLTNSVKDLGIVLAAQMVPRVLLVAFGGVWADRVSRRRVMLTADLVRAGAQGASAVLLVVGVAHIWELVVLQAMYGMATAFFSPAAVALVPETVESAHLQQANSLMAVSENVANIGGPALAGVLVATLGAGWGLAVDAATFLVSSASLALMPVTPPAPVALTTTIKELREGWRAFRSRTWLWASVISFMVANGIGLAPMEVLGPQVARTSLGGVGAWAAISATSGLGAVLGGLVGLRWRPQRPLCAMYLVTLVGDPILVALLGAAAPLALLLAAALLYGMALSLFNLLWFTAIQRAIPRNELARMSSWDSLGSFVASPLGLALSGPIAVAIGVSTTLYASAGVLVLVALGSLAVPSIRTFPELLTGGERSEPGGQDATSKPVDQRR